MDPTSIVVAAVSLIGVLAVGIVAPAYLLSRTEKIHREDRQADWARQDAVAAKAEAASRAIADRAAEAARLLAENNMLVAETAKETGKKLDVIHELVNSNMTAAMQSEFEAVTRELAMMREVVELRRAAGQEPGPDALAAIAATQAKLAELDVTLDDRAKAQNRVNQQIGLDVITTTSYRRQGDDETTSTEVSNEIQGAALPGDDPVSSAGCGGIPPAGHGGDGT